MPLKNTKYKEEEKKTKIDMTKMKILLLGWHLSLFFFLINSLFYKKEKKHTHTNIYTHKCKNYINTMTHTIRYT